MSDDSIDLIRKMLDRDLSTRLTMSQVLAHPVLPSLNDLIVVV
jgi:serine/threonine protein kinase